MFAEILIVGFIRKWKSNQSFSKIHNKTYNLTNINHQRYTRRSKNFKCLATKKNALHAHFINDGLNMPR